MWSAINELIYKLLVKVTTGYLSVINQDVIIAGFKVYFSDAVRTYIEVSSK